MSTEPSSQALGAHAVSSGDGTDDTQINAMTMKRRYYATVKLNPDSINRDLSRINEQVLDQLRLAKATINIRFEIQATQADGFDANVMSIIDKAAKNLKLDDAGFEGE